ncbi:hypothetical protein [Bacillus mycoides]|uniref:hypothetical protein n=1 Tax=Bacillus mycoides TaxID=1405 RepID=UPI001C02A19D|nr:hypothetical protein [Bacillus mycoides]QWH05197.1 hypothetical protein EXW49_05080 [Bacillus mycoides]
MYVKKKVYLTFFLLTLIGVMSGCSPDLKAAENYSKEILDKTDLAKYIKDVKYVEGAKLEDNTLYKYEIDIQANVSDDFYDFSKREQYLLMQEAIINLVGKGDRFVYCGDQDCRYGEMKLKNTDSTFSMVMEKYYAPDLNYEMKINDFVAYTRTDLENDRPTSSDSSTTTSTTVKPSTTNSNGQYASNGISYTVIFDFMKQQYNRLTNNDENYIPEVHDPQVAEIAAKHFGITAKEAGYIYEKVQMDAFN